MMRQILFACFFSILTLLSANAQCVLSGKVIDDKKESLPYVTIRLLEKDSIFIAGATTDSLGCFSFPKVNKGEYILALSSIGYTPKNFPIQVNKGHVDIGIITLPTQDIQLGEVIVKGSSFIRQKDKVLILPDKQQVKHANTGYDLLSNLMIPGLDVDRRTGTVSTLGGNATLYIDGRKVDYREVQSLRPKDVERIEYYDVPTGKYANDVAAINYITRKYKAGGYISLDANQTIGYLAGNYNAVAKLAHGNTSYTLFGGYDMKRYDGINTEGEELFHFAEQDIRRLTSTLDGNVKTNNQYVQLNVENRNDKRTLVGKLSFVQDDEPDNYNRNRLEYEGANPTIQESETQETQRGLKPNLNLYGYFNLKHDQFIEATFTGTYTNNDYTYSYQENNYKTFTRTDEDLYALFGNINYGIKFRHQNSLSGQLFHFHNISMSSYSGSNNTWQHLWTGETIFFVEYSHQIGKKFTLKAAPGFSNLQYKLHGAERVKQFSPRLRARLIYRLANNQQLQWTGNIGNTFPSISTMNNTTQFVDSLMIKRGNPTLTPAKLYGTGLIYGLQTGRFNLQSMVNYSRGKGVTTSLFYEENQKLVQSYSCNNNANIWNAYLSLSYKVTNNLRLKLDGSWMNLNCRGDLYEKFNSLSAKAQVDYYLKDFAFSLYGKSKEKQMNIDLVEITMPACYGLSISYNHKNLHAEVGTESPFTSKSEQVYEMTQNAYHYKNNLTSRTFQQTAYIKLAYTFDFGKKTNRSYNNVDRSINSAILKAR